MNGFQNPSKTKAAEQLSLRLSGVSRTWASAGAHGACC